MTERGMIFNGEMVRAILDGRKTQTRRIMKVQPESNQLGLLLITDSTKHSDIGKYHWAESNATGNHVRSKLFSCPFGAVGDRIWVRETWAEAGASAPDLKLYRANYPEHVPSIYENVPPAEEIRWTPSIHMPRTASRILLEITDVRVERLNAISQEDAQAEGMELTGWRPTYSDPDSGGEVMTPYDNFAELWSSIYGDESWKANPWVWVISFKRVEGGAA
ncbi:TPA: ASCH domain-containing protein [Klebsiella pneumoniae]|uniref:ASCH domain-containing protein n=1 Tax=Klebsiella pneumoniae TaxID=573 RepID=UPI0015DDCA9D|nr:ASCH domain-containing protein [Klebsiella pneumoniae]ELA2177767.1 ASCH domain-containing protein [Klebsiella pneumoniae]MBA0066082.1 ASCH domain-containing protein [Klebsiella pneumoniae]MCD5850315.1 ASCH domain-containing protein [Klebsiella pneumoniae]MDK1770768.1 ASCH domain-containing protein [Klebsiella pneumoniae]HBQ5510505.1 ASCH domain-containing protein [Klebsiella pneumoniae]